MVLIMKLIKKILLPILLIPVMSMVSCSFNKIENNNGNIEKDPAKDNIYNKLTKEQILYINEINSKMFVEKFPELLSSNGTLDLSIFKNLIAINENSFMRFKNIKKIIFNEKIREIKNNAFKDINSLIELEIPNSLETIGENAFNNAFHNENVFVNFNHNVNLKNIGSGAFNNSNIKISVSNDEIRKKIIQSGFEESKILFGENSSGGHFSNLSVDKYFSIISTLDINDNTILSSLTSEKLTNELKIKFPNKNYKLSILENSSEYNGLLNLNLVIDGKNYGITVSGFNSLKKDEKYIINEISINKNEWFKNFQTESNIKNWNDENWKSYLLNLEIANYDLNKFYNLLDYGKNIEYKIKYDNKKIFILLSTHYKKFNKNNWVDDENISSITIGLKNNTGYVLELPTKNDLYNFIKNILELNETNKNIYVSQRYSSYYLHGAKYLSNNLLNNILQIPNNYLEYIKKNLNFNGSDRISIEFFEIFPNDFDGILRFSYNFVNANDNKILFSGIYEISGFKKIDLKNINFNMKIIKGNNSLFNTYLKIINSHFSKEQLNGMNENQSFDIDNFGFIGNNSGINLLHDGNDQDVNSKRVNFDSFNEKYELSLNDIVLNEDSINFDTNYFDSINNGIEGYVIKYLSINTDKKYKAKITKINNLWQYNFPIKISMGISNATSFSVDTSKEITIEKTCSMIMNENDINSLKK